MASKTTTPVGRIQEQQARLQNQVRTLEQRHNRLMESLNTQQQSRMQNSIHEMEQTRSRIQTQMQEMSRTTRQPNLNREQVTQQARKMEQSMIQWQDQYQGLVGQMGTEP